MPKLTIERMREIMIEANVSELGYAESHVVDIVLSHPEIKSLFEEEATSMVVDLSTYVNVEGDELYFCPKCANARMEFGEKDCYKCKIELIWPERVADSGKTIDNGNSQGMLDGSIKAYEVVEYSLDAAGYSYTICKYRLNYTAGSNGCKNHCKDHFQGHEIEGKSIRCAFEVNNEPN